ncbi:glycerate kinase [Maribacter sp. HTCC2170]|uniref:glycerate kinase n=1 Tax=Maribacter sp. (strain HTCC2170 / KCCM 42371) TaxID=313603 RepID=UPI00006BD24E|nr:glycerate kinase [Maribacter sp. HTCC2170]EAR02910.1 hypothetical protein FB2170_06465 [Maribacter sp. HTCC2170]
MKFVVAPDKFKGSLSGFEFCEAVEEGLRMVFKNAEITKIPLADGGDGTIDVVNTYINGQRIIIQAKDPFFRSMESSYVYSPGKQIAFIEMAEASGLKLLPKSEYDCMQATSFGTGELIVDALEKGAKEIILGIGGSATNDGGMGMASALGYRFLDADNQELEPIGKNMVAVCKIDNSEVRPRLKGARIKVACDVTNPFYGEQGAAKIYAAQKGATTDEIEVLNAGLRNLAEVVQKEYGIDLQQEKGAGAAGGTGGGAIAFLHGHLTSGIDLIKELSEFDSKIVNADWIITGEGQLDEQTLSGKTMGGVVQSAKLKGIPVAAFCGAVDLSIEMQEEFGLSYVTSILRKVTSLEDAMNSSYDNLVNASYNFAKILG